MRWKSLFLVFFILLFGASMTAQAQIAASRRIDWSQAGVPGGIPNRTHDLRHAQSGSDGAPRSTVRSRRAATESCI